MLGSKILVVEDNPDDELLTLRALRQQDGGVVIDVCRDGVEAIDYLKQCADDGAGQTVGLPQVVLLDLNLPRISGLDVLEWIRSNEATRRLPVVMLTSSNETSDLQKAYDRGVNSYIRKPVNFDDFVETARHLGQYWLKINETAPGN